MGAWRTAYGWQDLTYERFSFGTRLAAVCDVPDLELLPQRFPGVRSVSFRAALEVPVQHHALWLLAACRRVGIPVPLARLAAAMERAATWLNWLGSDTGGMVVRVCGTDRVGHPSCRTWELVARSNHGPEIPCMPAVLLATKICEDGLGWRGARVCMGMLALTDFEVEFARWDISSCIVDRRP